MYPMVVLRNGCWQPSFFTVLDYLELESNNPNEAALPNMESDLMFLEGDSGSWCKGHFLLKYEHPFFKMSCFTFHCLFPRSNTLYLFGELHKDGLKAWRSPNRLFNLNKNGAKATISSTKDLYQFPQPNTIKIVLQDMESNSLTLSFGSYNEMDNWMEALSKSIGNLVIK